MRLRPLHSAPVLAAPALLSACSALPPPRVSFDSPDPEGRAQALRLAAASRDDAAIPEYIELLDSDDATLRMLAHRALTEQTGQNFGYDYAAPEPLRSAAAARWADWWRQRQAQGAQTSPPASKELAPGGGDARPVGGGASGR